MAKTAGIVAAFVVLVAAAVWSVHRPERLTASEARVAANFWVSGVALGVLLTRAFWPPVAAGAADRPKSVGATITMPERNDRFPVGSTVTVAGTFERDPRPGEELVVGAWRNGRYYPQSRLSTGGRTWQCLCDASHPGEMILYVGVADERFLAVARHHAEVGRAGKGWHGIKLGTPLIGASFDHAVAIQVDPAG